MAIRVVGYYNLRDRFRAWLTGSGRVGAAAGASQGDTTYQLVGFLVTGLWVPRHS